MKKNKETLITTIFIIGIISWIFLTMMPEWISKEDAPHTEFSTKRALVHVSKISEKPHYVGSENHAAVGDYLKRELEKLGLETTIQEGTTLSDWGNLVKSKNILARIKGTNSSKALVLLSHYDSAPHSASHGAADDATGIAAILEGVRTFITTKSPNTNDIIILFSDAEELGLNGAALFVTENGWAKDVGLVLNFEARGTSGPSYMLMEVNKGNAKLIDGFAEANPDFPVANSLMYSIYKMLPNDTDLTVFREQGKIQGFNFAFIDDHFNYHTVQDDIAHLDHRSLAHQGSYLMPLLNYFANADLTNLTTDEDDVYFSTPFNLISYPFSWVFPMLVIAILLFLFFLFIGLGKRTLIASEIGKGFVYLLGALTVTGVFGYFGWKTLLVIYPKYGDILQGFTYNGHAYILAFIFMGIAVGFLFYGRRNPENIILSHFVAPIFLWIIINLAIAIYLPGAGFFIIPVFCALLMFAYFVLTQRVNMIFNLIFSIPALILLVPFIWMFPIGLGLKILFGCSLLTVLVFTLLLPILSSFPRKGLWSFVMFLISVGFLIYAHLNSDYAPGKARPNSLVYYYDAEKDKAVWATCDNDLDDWTERYLRENPAKATELNVNPLFSKYNTAFTFSAEAPMKSLVLPTIEFLRDTVIGTQRHFRIKIIPNRKVNRYDIFADENLVIHNFKANGAKSLGQKGSAYLRKGRKILSYYVTGNEPLEMQFSIGRTSSLNMELFESSFDLMTDPQFNMAKRTPLMMPKPFILTDAVIVHQKIRPTPKIETPVITLPFIGPVSDTIQTQEQEITDDAQIEL